MRAKFEVGPDEPLGFLTGTVRMGWGEHLRVAEDDERWQDDPYDVELFLMEADEPDEHLLRIFNVANGDDLYINIADIIKLLNGEILPPVLGPGPE